MEGDNGFDATNGFRLFHSTFLLKIKMRREMMIIIAIFYFRTKELEIEKKQNILKMLKKGPVPDFTGQFNLGRIALKALSCAQWDREGNSKKLRLRKSLKVR